MRLTACISSLALSLISIPAFAANNYTYLALGDSVPFGMNPLLINPVYPQPPAPADGYVGYPEYLSAAFALKHLNAACPGESTGSFLYAGKIGYEAQAEDFGCNSEHLDPHVVPFKQIGLHTAYTGAQMDFAMSQLAANKKINLVTLTIGSNDLFVALQHCALNPYTDCVPIELGKAYNAVGQNLAMILMGIRSQYSGTLVVMGYYSPSAEFDQLALQLNEVIKTVLTQLNSQPGFAAIRYADGFAAFKAASTLTGGEACPAGLLIKLPAGSPTPCDIHPSKIGQTILAGTVVLAK
jgi:hypothetical protein